MKTSKGLALLIMLITAALLAGCADSTFLELEREKGMLTYQQALERWGPPVQKETSGGLTTARWLWPYSSSTRELVVWFDAQGRMTKYDTRTWATQPLERPLIILHRRYY